VWLVSTICHYNIAQPITRLHLVTMETNNNVALCTWWHFGLNNPKLPEAVVVKKMYNCDHCIAFHSYWTHSTATQASCHISLTCQTAVQPRCIHARSIAHSVVIDFNRGMALTTFKCHCFCILPLVTTTTDVLQHYTRQPVSVSTSSLRTEWLWWSKVLLTTYMPLLMATTAFELGRRH